MQLIHGIHNLHTIHRPSVVSIGNYDGVHLGHQSLIQSLLEKSSELGVPSTVITFEPLAKEFFRPGSVALLSSVQQRAEQLFSLGVDQILCIDFDDKFAAYSPAKFIRDVLLEGLGVQYLCVGDDFRFGKDRAGDFDLLETMGREHGFSVTAHETFTLDGTRVSSGRIRDALSNGDFGLAENLLGRPYSIAGIISQGQQLGRTLNFPTANIVLDSAQTAVQGVYAVKVTGVGNRVLHGVANVGTRPTVDGKQNRLEVHIFDFDSDIYGVDIDVSFHCKLRSEQKFDSLDALTAQIHLDSKSAKNYFQEKGE
ncbi:MAG: riboflavin kinase/FMN adenylyltransferase [Arenicella sp.]|jgi:riboflavin kinase/FMN adenylyltransferase